MRCIQRNLVCTTSAAAPKPAFVTWQPEIEQSSSAPLDSNRVSAINRFFRGVETSVSPLLAAFSSDHVRHMIKEDALAQDIAVVIGSKTIAQTSSIGAVNRTQYGESISITSQDIRSRFQSRLNVPDACRQNSVLVCALLLSILDVSTGSYVN